MNAVRQGETPRFSWPTTEVAHHHPDALVVIGLRQLRKTDVIAAELHIFGLDTVTFGRSIEDDVSSKLLRQRKLA